MENKSAPTAEIEITPAMIRAGVAAVENVEADGNDESLVRAVFAAMLAARNTSG